jgi:hypothetical protein
MIMMMVQMILFLKMKNAYDDSFSKRKKGNLEEYYFEFWKEFPFKLEHMNSVNGRPR